MQSWRCVLGKGRGPLSVYMVSFIQLISLSFLPDILQAYSKLSVISGILVLYDERFTTFTKISYDFVNNLYPRFSLVCLNLIFLEAILFCSIVLYSVAFYKFLLQLEGL